MAASDSETNLMRERARGIAGRWTGARTFVCAAAAVFFLLWLAGALNFWLAIFAFALLAGVVLLRGLLTGETQGIALMRTAQPSSGITSLASGAGRTILNELPDPLIVLDSGGRILFCNKAAEGLTGPQALGKHVATMLRSATLVTAIDEVLKGGAAQSVEYAMPVPVERNYSAFITPIEADAIPADGGALSEASRRRRDRVVLVALRDVTEVRRVEDMRVDFVAFASHELKTPLASLSGFIDTLRGHAKDDPVAQERFLEIMAEQADRMRRLIDDLLSLSRIELREHVRPDNVVDLLGVVSDVTDGLTHLAQQNGVEISVASPAILPRVRGDREELGQVVQNLVDNALRYGRAGKRVEVTLAADTRSGKPMVRMSVRDFGGGISREHLPRLTERFYRVDAAASRAKGGTGLGLAIVKHIVNRHQGTLAIDSELGQGSTFSVLIPAVAETLPA
ncbi:MAG TPA: ATP-binding protein [Parvibaculum sp.]|jgi:two-component system phosphate regulon sensor histidine kinase PhoR